MATAQVMLGGVVPGAYQGPARAAAIARVAKVSKSYDSVQALREVDFTIGAGEVVALLGPNGAGKSTLVRLLLGLASPTSGRVTVFGGDPKDPGTRERVGAMLQVGGVPSTMKVREHIDLFSSYYPKPLPLAEVVEMAGLQGIGGVSSQRVVWWPEAACSLCAGNLWRSRSSFSR